MKYWINTISRDHVSIGKKEGIVQAGHGKQAALMSANDKSLKKNLFLDY